MICNLLAAGKASPAVSYGLGQGATMVAALWGVLVLAGVSLGRSRRRAAADVDVRRLFRWFVAGDVHEGGRIIAVRRAQKESRPSRRIRVSME